MDVVELDQLEPSMSGLIFSEMVFECDVTLPTRWENCVFYGCEFSGQLPDKVQWEQCVWHNCRFNHVEMNQHVFEQCCWYQCDFVKNDWSHIEIVQSQFSGCRFRLSEWRQCQADGVSWFKSSQAGLYHCSSSWIRGSWYETHFCGDLQYVTDSSFVDCTVAHMGDMQVALDRLTFDGCRLHASPLDQPALYAAVMCGSDNNQFTARDAVMPMFNLDAFGWNGGYSADLSAFCWDAMLGGIEDDGNNTSLFLFRQKLPRYTAFSSDQVTSLR